MQPRRGGLRLMPASRLANPGAVLGVFQFLVVSKVMGVTEPETGGYLTLHQGSLWEASGNTTWNGETL